MAKHQPAADIDVPYPPPEAEQVMIIDGHPTLTFIINALLAFIEIKSQGHPGFPFVTHPQVIMYSVTSLIMYGLASAAELLFLDGGLDPTSDYVIAARFGRICSLCILLACLSSVFYF